MWDAVNAAGFDEEGTQLEMLCPQLHDLPPLPSGSDIRLRSYQPGDERHWARIIGAGLDPEWTAERFLSELAPYPAFDPQGCLFALADALPQATAMAWAAPGRAPDTGYLHMVAVAPEWRSRGLGRLVTLAALHRLRERGFRRVVLHTDDWRTPAISLYRSLGFQPVYLTAGHERRWAAILSR